jgi:hypothetical protein
MDSGYRYRCTIVEKVLFFFRILSEPTGQQRTYNKYETYHVSMWFCARRQLRVCKINPRPTAHTMRARELKSLLPEPFKPY